MNAYLTSTSASGHGSVSASWHRMHGMSGAPYLVGLVVQMRASYPQGSSTCPQARAVMDDFGNLVLVGPWR